MDKNIAFMKYPLRDLQAGKLLVASPALEDEHFKRAVILLAEHTASGSLYSISR